MRIVAIGDIGVVDDMIHIGDEAMFEEFATQVSRRGVAGITALSVNPRETQARYGVAALQNLGFSPAAVGDRAGMVSRFDRVLRTAGGATGLLSADDSAHVVIAAVRDADGVAITGGGNMASIWPMHVFERACLGRLAALFGKPLVVSGQTIGPELDGDDRSLVGSLLSSARLVGLRESASARLVQDLGVPAGITQGTIDDASFVGAGAPASGAVGGGPASGAVGVPASGPVGDGGAPEAMRPYLLVTLARHLNGVDPAAFATSLAALLDRVASPAGLEIVFLAHFASLVAGDERGDSVEHRRVIDALVALGSDVPWRIEPTTTSTAAASVAREASLVITSRYHPAVFAVAAGVPTVGIAVDDYTTVKLTGALGNFGQDAVVTATGIVDGSAATTVLDAWGARVAIQSSWESRIDAARTASDAWWDRVAAALAR
ncbi:hypothetical protein AX769_11485 [Frondihabitans sp. PAMC 28766]|uniref:polysaccharide pyruvyl transferase family protein n=1 Tax=Frondihabitans sp. PAMC 28766 TaxID=1795630 RepID=UPI00078E787C|nr:polysaccharide pyruvyl transferase family protein [Frondihabitans sp. PAMC 28766]AMM20651.1 hypothetical protein AX769_11485 [Frondihabitans sp. PAMC 28766]